MGTGDWNDGMNCVGAQGKGESVWLGFFLYDVLERFTELARRRGDLAFAERCQTEAAKVQRNIEESGWDGAVVPARLLRRRHAAWGRQAAPSARSIPSRKAGPCCPGPATPQGHTRP
jgi:hypothetical protein